MFARRRSKVSQRPGPAEERTIRKSLALWDLSTLYSGTDSPEVADDLANAGASDEVLESAMAHSVLARYRPWVEDIPRARFRTRVPFMLAHDRGDDQRAGALGLQFRASVGMDGLTERQRIDTAKW
jgi:hypothetical protein